MSGWCDMFSLYYFYELCVKCGFAGNCWRQCQYVLLTETAIWSTVDVEKVKVRLECSPWHSLRYLALEIGVSNSSVAQMMTSLKLSLQHFSYWRLNFINLFQYSVCVCVCARARVRIYECRGSAYFALPVIPVSLYYCCHSKMTLLIDINWKLEEAVNGRWEVT